MKIDAFETGQLLYLRDKKIGGLYKVTGPAHFTSQFDWELEDITGLEWIEHADQAHVYRLATEAEEVMWELAHVEG